MIRVLVVEDSRTQAFALCADLEAAGFAASLARSGPEALSLLEANEFEVIVSDVVMPGMDGYELCRRVKADPRTREIPVVLLTSMIDPLDVVSGLESGADNFMRKPYQAEQLTGRLRAAVHNQELRRTGQMPIGVRLSFLERDFDITAERQQILDLLISTFEDLVVTSREVRAREDDLVRAHADLEQQLHTVGLERNRLQAVVDSVPVSLFVIAPTGLISHASEAGARTFHTTTTEIRGRKLDDIAQFFDSDGVPIPPTMLPHHTAVVAQKPVTAGSAFDVFLAGLNGTRLPVVLQASPIFDDRGRPAGCVETAHVLGALTEHDAVTGLPNSAAYLDRAASVLASPRADSALMLLEIDRFDVIRASLGPTASNAVLVDVSRRLRRIFDSTPGAASSCECFLAYLGGNQFGVVLANLPGSFNVLHLAESARRLIADRNIADDTVRLTVSVGVALDDQAHEGPQMFAAANAALRRARDAGGDRVELFGHAASQEAIDRLQLEVDLRTAVEHGEIQLHYQPEVDLASGKLIGFEALARWQHERLGFIGPDVFISLAEESGIILPLGRHLLGLACAQARLWQDLAGCPELTIAVNVSAMQLQPEFVEEVTAVLKAAGLDPARLMLEVTETAAMSDPGTTVPIIEELRGHGVRFALDDFGSGYSSLAQLTRIRFDQLKLDRGFVARMHEGGTDAIVAQSIIALGHSLGVPVLAEGIERPSQAEMLRDLGCEQAQGYLFSKPLSGEAVESFLNGVLERGLVVETGTPGD